MISCMSWLDWWDMERNDEMGMLNAEYNLSVAKFGFDDDWTIEEFLLERKGFFWILALTFCCWVVSFGGKVTKFVEVIHLQSTDVCRFIF